jgi:hypothetical protein
MTSDPVSLANAQDVAARVKRRLAKHPEERQAWIDVGNTAQRLRDAEFMRKAQVNSRVKIIGAKSKYATKFIGLEVPIWQKGTSHITLRHLPGDENTGYYEDGRRFHPSELELVRRPKPVAAPVPAAVVKEEVMVEKRQEREDRRPEIVDSVLTAEGDWLVQIQIPSGK